MEKYDVKVRYIFEGTYTVVAEDREEAESMVAEDCGLVLGGNIHTTRDDDEVTDWKFGCHPDLQVLSVRQRGGKSSMSVFGDRIEELRKDIIEAIRQLLHDHAMNAIRFPEEDYDPVWVIWFGKNGDPYECRVTGLRVTSQQPDRPCRRRKKAVMKWNVTARSNSEPATSTGFPECMRLYGATEESKVEPQTEEQ